MKAFLNTESINGILYGPIHVYVMQSFVKIYDMVLKLRSKMYQQKEQV